MFLVDLYIVYNYLIEIVWFRSGNVLEGPIVLCIRYASSLSNLKGKGQFVWNMSGIFFT